MPTTDIVERLSDAMERPETVTVKMLREARDLLEKLPVTADGVRVTPRMGKVFEIDPTGYIQGFDVGHIIATDDSSYPSLRHLYYGGCYASLEAAEAALQEQQAKEDG